MRHKIVATDAKEVWGRIHASARQLISAGKEDARTHWFNQGIINVSILSHDKLSSSLAILLASKLDAHEAPRYILDKLFTDVFDATPSIIDSVVRDLSAVVDRDPAAHGQMIYPFLFFKGFHALETHRIAHELYLNGDKLAAFWLQSKCSQRFTVDIHPAAKIGSGILFDHAHGIVIGETAEVGNNVSMLHGVTLGGTGKQGGLRHPIVDDDVEIGAGAKVLGRIRIGKGAKVAAESVVLKDVAPYTTVVGVPARVPTRNQERDWIGVFIDFMLPRIR